MAATMGMTTAVLDQILRTKTNSGRVAPFAPTSLDLELLEAADAAVRTRRPIAFVLPTPSPSAPVYLAAGAIVGAVLSHHRLDAAVGVAATHLSSATSYDRLHMRTGQLSKLVARARVTADRDVRTLRGSGSAVGRLYVTGALDRLTGLLGSLDAVVVDASAASSRALEVVLAQAPGPVLIYITKSALDPNLDLLRARGVLLWGWDQAALLRLSQPAASSSLPAATLKVPETAGPLVSSTGVLEAAGSSTVTVVGPVNGNILDDVIAQLWACVGALHGAHVKTAPGSPAGRLAATSATQWVWGLYHVAATLPVSPERYDQHARTVPHVPVGKLGDAPVIARQFARTQPPGVVRQSWYDVADAFEQYLDVAGKVSKFPSLVDWVAAHSAVERGLPGVVVVRNQSVSLAVVDALSASTDVPDGWQQLVQVATPREVDSLILEHAGQVDVCLTGGVTRRQAGMLAAPACRELTVVTAGPRESRRVYLAAVDAMRKQSDVRWETTEMSSAVLDVAPRAPYVVADSTPVTLVGQPDLPEASEDYNPWEPFAADVNALVLDLLRDTDPGDNDPPAPVRVDDDNLETFVDAVFVHIENPHTKGRVVALGPNDVVTRSRDGRVERVATKSIRDGDVLLLVNQQARQDLLSTVIAKLSESTTYAALAMLIRFWHDHAWAARDLTLTYADILARMPTTAVTSDSTIGAWVRSDVDGPLDKADIKRFAEATGDRALAAEAERVGQALDTLHRVHRKAGAWLSAQIRGAPMASGDATVDASLDIHVADLLDAVTRWEVTAVEELRLSVPTALLGLLLSPSVADSLRGDRE